MKKTTAILTALLVMAVLFASCSNGMGEKAEGSASGSSTQAVKVSLSLGGEVANIIQKEVALTGGGNASSYTYYYKATPNWKKANDDPVDAKGKTDGFVKILYPGQDNHDYVDDFSLGYFTPGNWKFDVEIRDGETVLYTGTNNNVSITTAGAEVIVPMTINTANNATGTVKIAVAVPNITYSKVIMELDGTPITQVTNAHDKKARATSPTAYTEDTVTGWELFKKDTTPETGNHTLVLQYLDYPTQDDYTNETNEKVVGGAAIAFTLLKGETYLVCGTIENGKFQIVTLTLEMPTIDLQWTTEPAASVAQEAACACAVTAGYANYKWYVNGALVSSGSAQYNLPTAWPGDYEVTCEAEKSIQNGGTVRDYISKTVTVNPAKVINIISKVDEDGDGVGDGKNVKAAHTGDSIVCTPVGAGIVDQSVARVEWWISKDGAAAVKQTAVIAGNVFTFATTPTPSTTSTAAEGSYKIVCKTYDAAQGGNLVGYGEKTITLTVQP